MPPSNPKKDRRYYYKTFGGVAEPGHALGLQSRRRKFKSYHHFHSVPTARHNFVDVGGRLFVILGVCRGPHEGDLLFC